MEVPIEDIEEEGDDVEVIMHQQDDESDASAEECKFNSRIRTAKVMNLTPSVDRARLRVVRCTLAWPEQIDNWRITVIFQTCTKIGKKSCRVVDNDSCINAVASKLITILGMKPVKHPNPYKVTCDATSIDLCFKYHLIWPRYHLMSSFLSAADMIWRNRSPCRLQQKKADISNIAP